MILPITAYGDPVLKKKAAEIDKSYPDLSQLIENMFETMYHARGVGLAAPQVGLSIRLFVIDTAPFAEDDEEEDVKELEFLKSFKRVFINPQILDERGEKWEFSEGCLSIPEIREDVSRYEEVQLQYLDENFKSHTAWFKGLAARVIQHEYDHIEGKLFTDYLSAIRKRMLAGKLEAIAKGEVKVAYRMKFPKKKKR